MRTFLFDCPAADKPGPVLTVIGGSDKVDTSVDPHDIADIGEPALFYIIGDGDIQKILTMLLYEFGCAKFIDGMVEVF